MATPREELKSARQRTGKSPEEVAAAAGISAPSYYDLEWADGEIKSAISLGTLEKICAELRTRVSDLFIERAITDAEKISPEGLVTRIRNHLDRNRLTISEFETRVGFEIRGCLDSASSIRDWDVECLRSVCDEIGVSWVTTLS